MYGSRNASIPGKRRIDTPNVYGGRIQAQPELQIPWHLGTVFTVDGSATVNAIGSAPPSVVITLDFTGTPTFKASSRLVIPGGADVTFAAGDTVSLMSRGNGVWKLLSPLVVAFPVPGGRLTLTSGTSVTTTDVTGATSIYYTPTATDVIPIYNGAQFAPTTFTELTLALDSNSGHTGYQQSGKNFDLFVCNDSGTVRLGTGPAWSSDTARGTGAGTTELQLLKGLWTNKNSITLRFGSASGNTVSVAANKATYVGSFRASADGQATDSKIKRWLFNAFNQARRYMFVTDPVLSYNYSTAAWAQFNSSAANQLDVLIGLDGVLATVKSAAVATNSVAAQGNILTGIGLDSVTANSALTVDFSTVTTGEFKTVRAEYSGYPGLGRHYYSWLVQGAGANTQTWYGTNSGAFGFSPGLVGDIWM